MNVYVLKGKHYCERCGANVPGARGPKVLEKPRDELLICYKCGTTLFGPLTPAGLLALETAVLDDCYNGKQAQQIKEIYGLDFSRCNSCGRWEKGDPTHQECSVTGCRGGCSKCGNITCVKCATKVCSGHTYTCETGAHLGKWCDACYTLHVQNTHHTRFLIVGVPSFEFLSDVED